jgi:hypothetical protein
LTITTETKLVAVADGWTAVDVGTDVAVERAVAVGAVGVGGSVAVGGLGVVGKAVGTARVGNGEPKLNKAVGVGWFSCVGRRKGLGVI